MSSTDDDFTLSPSESPEDWGPTCARCGTDEFRVDGYCTVECRDMHEVEQERDQALASLTEHQRALEAVREMQKEEMERSEWARKRRDSYDPDRQAGEFQRWDGYWLGLRESANALLSLLPDKEGE